jgi:ankyrin repeat protein
MKQTSSIFWIAVGLQCAGAVVLNTFYSASPSRFGMPSGASDARVARTMPAAIARPPELAPPSSARVTPLMQMAGDGHCEEVRRLISNGANVNTVNVNGSDALIYAASAGHVECVRLLVEAGANISRVDNAGDSALSAAKQQGFSQVVGIIEYAKR